MRAVVLEAWSGPVGLVLRECRTPVPRPGEVLVRIAAVAASRSDLEIMSRGFVGHRVRLPLVPGVEAVGTVVSAGDASEVSVGSRVAVMSPVFCGGCERCRTSHESECTDSRIFGLDIPGGLAEMVAVPAAAVSVLPHDVDFITAACVSHILPVALNVVRQAAVDPGGVLLVTGAGGGGVGTMVVQIAHLRGVRVIGTATTESAREIARLVGADEVVDTSKLSGGLAAVAPGGVDGLVTGGLSRANWRPALAALRRNGRAVVYGALGARSISVDLRALFRKRVILIGVSGHSRDEVRAAFEMTGQHKIRVVIDSVRQVDDAVAAYEAVAAGRTHGRVILSWVDDVN